MKAVEWPNVPDAARALLKRHLGYGKSFPLFNRLVDGEVVHVLVPVVEDADLLIRELADCGFTAARHEPPAEVDVRAIREKTGLTQEEFAVRFGLDLSTVRNWEQERSSPDLAGRTILHLIDRAPDTVARLLDEAPAG